MLIENDLEQGIKILIEVEDIEKFEPTEQPL